MLVRCLMDRDDALIIYADFEKMNCCLKAIKIT